MQNPRGCWRICAAAALALFCTLGLNINSFSVFIPYLTKSLALTFSESSGFLMVRNICSTGAVFLAKYYYDKLDIRFGLTIAMLMNIFGMFLYATAESFGNLCIAAAVSGLSYGLGGMYPVALLIHRWFPFHESVAMGICAASSGLALTVCVPVLTFLTENYSMSSAMFAEMIFLVGCTVACFLMIQNYPKQKLHFINKQSIRHQNVKISWMFFAIVAIGMLGGGFSYLTIHYTTENFDPYQVSTLISVLGLVLTGAKFLLGGMLDHWGAYRTNWIFLSLAVISCVIFSLGGTVGYPVALLAACFYGIGDSVATVGISAYAKDLSTPDKYSATQQQYQTASLLGGVITALICGPISSATGNYRVFYIIITAAMVFSTIVIQTTYRKKKSRY